jgi:PAS domain S-box-containing protein
MFAALIENSSDFIGIADSSGKPKYLNPAGRKMVGLAPDVDVSTLAVEDFYPLGLRAVPEIVAGELIEKGRWSGESRLRHWQTGESIPISDTRFFIHDPESGAVLGIGTVARDISLAKHHRDELREANQRLSDAMHDLAESQRFLQAILDHSPIGIIIKSLEGRYLVINKGFESLTGVSAAASLGKSDFDVFPRPLAERFRANDKIVRETRAPLVTEERTELDHQGRVMLVSKFPLLDERLEVFAVCAIWTDITERKHTEEALRTATLDLRAAQRVAHVGSWRWDRQTETTYWSEELYKIFGQDPLGDPPSLLKADSKVFAPESTERLRSAVHKLLIDGQPYELDLEFIRPDGSRGWVSAHGEAVRNATGEIVGLDGTAADITHIKTLQRMREEWTSVIAHDLRQPIGIIAMASDFLPTIHGGKMNAEENAFMDRIRSAARTLARMVDDLLDLSLLEANRLKLERKWVDPCAMVNESVARLSHLTGANRVKVVGRNGLAPLFVDPMRIDQVLGNLVSNAVKYGDKDRTILLRLDRREGEVEISVTNHGKGIEAEDLPRLFDRFARSKTTRGSGVPGLGLGLYISKGVVEAHGGRLWAESVPGKTTTFHITLPAVISAREAA